MPPYHQGSFMVSSSPILPLDVQPIRPMRPAPLSHLSPPFDYHYTSPTCPDPPAFAPQAPRFIPSNWTDDATAVSLDIHGVYPQYGRGSPDTQAGLSPPHPPSHQLVNMPAGWDLPMDQGPYASLPQGTEAGTTFFYRSPTPSARQRTKQACEKCRDRKTKCSGGRPCDRCQTRGLLCEYDTQHRVRGPAKARKRTSPSLDTPMSASRNRALFSHYRPYAPATPSVNSRWDLQLSSACSRGRVCLKGSRNKHGRENRLVVVGPF
ncbi:hypothetical protein JB92DRAFT_997753 [Gautieria morchelliformis]|nr:hypothetical protein JB92DRAFT_997753 [Gautieria morchelliformis]